MTAQHEYNEWFKMMLSEHLVKHEYIIQVQTYEGKDCLNAIIFHQNDKVKNIEISTYGRELTLSIWQHHEHHASFEDDNLEEEFRNLCGYIDDIVSDKVFFAVGYKKGSITYGTASYDFENLLDEKADQVEIKSWSGIHDQLIENKE